MASFWKKFSWGRKKGGCNSADQSSSCDKSKCEANQNETQATSENDSNQNEAL